MIDNMFSSVLHGIFQNVGAIDENHIKTKRKPRIDKEISQRSFFRNVYVF
jgi:hypothetical protein